MPSIAFTPKHWEEIDLLRAVAGALMVTNHAGVKWLSVNDVQKGLNLSLVFAGSLAPVLFFTVTGMGRGVQSMSTGRKPLGTTPRKVLTLLLADAAFWLTPRTFIGLDFLGFIAISTIVLELVQRTRRPTLIALLGLLCILGVRFLLAPSIGLPPHGGVLLSLLHFFLGDFSVQGVAYPLGPWLAFPLLGLVLGRLSAGHSTLLRTSSVHVALGLAVLSLLGFAFCALLARRGMEFFRWGTMSFAYCALGFAAILAGSALVLWAAQTLPTRVIKAVSLEGVTSFTLVPLHYALIAIAGNFIHESSNGVFPLILGAFMPLVFFLSKRFSDLIVSFSLHARGNSWPSIMNFLIVGALVLLSRLEAPGYRLPVTTLAQFVACSLFVLSSRQKQSEGT